MTDGMVYDVVIVGAGIAGAILAKQLSRAGKQVLILEAGRATSMDPEGYRTYVENYYQAQAKVPNSPYPANPNAPSASVLDITAIKSGIPADNGYMVQEGPLPFASDYLRAKGGTMLHWLGCAFRMVPNDFQLKTLYGHGVDWPISYGEMDPYYEQAEWEIGVSADTADQEVHGIRFRPGYRFPMRRIPQSWLDQRLTSMSAGKSFQFGKRETAISIVPTPQGRNSMPNKIEGTNRDYEPLGMIGDPYTGERCEGNASCVPICPVQAKYNALKTLYTAAKERVTIVNQAIATEIVLDSFNGRVSGIRYQLYQDEALPVAVKSMTVTGKLYVIAANAIETAKLCLASGVANSSTQLGRNLMDHPTLLAWGLMPERTGAFRGPGQTSNITTFRDGAFRSQHSAFIVPVDNWGWGWSTFAPATTLSGWLSEGLFGRKLKETVEDGIPRQMALQFEFEQPPSAENSVTIDRRYTDQMGNYRPVIRYNLTPYVREAMAVARAFSRDAFAKLGIQDCTEYSPSDPTYFEYSGEGYSYRGAGHLVGTHCMGANSGSSVVDTYQRTWDHDNLYLVGCGSMPTIGTSNPSLTLAALAFRTAERIIRDLQ